MSEDEQSGSNFDTRGNLQRAHLLLCVMASCKPGERWSTNTRDFAVAVDRRVEGNPIAREMIVLTNVAGRHCPDFDEMIEFACTSGMIVRCYGNQYGWMDLRMSDGRRDDGGVLERGRWLRVVASLHLLGCVTWRAGTEDDVTVIDLEPIFRLRRAAEARRLSINAYGEALRSGRAEDVYKAAAVCRRTCAELTRAMAELPNGGI